MVNYIIACFWLKETMIESDRKNVSLNKYSPTENVVSAR